MDSAQALMNSGSVIVTVEGEVLLLWIIFFENYSVTLFIPRTSASTQSKKIPRRNGSACRERAATTAQTTGCI